MKKKTSKKKAIKRNAVKASAAKTKALKRKAIKKAAAIKDFKGPFRSANLEMIRSVVTFAQDPANVATTNSIPAFAAIITQLASNVQDTDALVAQVAKQIKGLAADKTGAKQTLIAATLPIVKAVFSYAMDTDNIVLANEMSTTKSVLNKKTYSGLVAFTQIAFDSVSPIIGSLGSYNVTPSDLTDWQVYITDLATILANVNVAYKNRKTLLGDIQVILVDSMDLLVNSADTLATQFTLSDPSYYANYRNNRKLMPYGHMSTQLRLHVVDVNNNPVTEGEVLIVGTDRSGTLDALGYCLIDYIPFGKHNVAITTPAGLKTLKGITFKKGKSFTVYTDNVPDSMTKKGAPSKVTVNETSVPVPASN